MNSIGAAGVDRSSDPTAGLLDATTASSQLSVKMAKASAATQVEGNAQADAQAEVAALLDIMA